jgi:hypothetical protein
MFSPFVEVRENKQTKSHEAKRETSREVEGEGNRE